MLELRTAGSAMHQANTSTTLVRIAVAKFEFTPSTPIFARIAVIPAKRADNKDQVNQFIPRKCREPRGVQGPTPSLGLRDNHRCDGLLLQVSNQQNGPS